MTNDPSSGPEGERSTVEQKTTYNIENNIDDSDGAVIDVDITEGANTEEVSPMKWWVDTLDNKIENLEDLLEEEASRDRLEAKLNAIEHSHLEVEQYSFLSGVPNYERCMDALEEATIDSDQEYQSTTFRDDLDREATEEDIQTFIQELNTLIEQVDYNRETKQGSATNG